MEDFNVHDAYDASSSAKTIDVSIDRRTQHVLLFQDAAQLQGWYSKPNEFLQRTLEKPERHESYDVDEIMELDLHWNPLDTRILIPNAPIKPQVYSRPLL